MDEKTKYFNRYCSRRRRITYPDGVVTKCITISKKADDLLLEKDIVNVSQFINDIIVFALADNHFQKQETISRFNQIQKEMEILGYSINIESIKQHGLNINGKGES